MSLYAEAMGEAFAALPGTLRHFHTVTARHVWKGEVEVTRGASRLARFLATFLGFPPAGQGPMTLTMERDGPAERWTREFTNGRLASRITPGPRPGSLLERFGPAAVVLRPLAADGGMILPAEGASFLRVPVPGFLRPVSETRETAEGERMFFDVAGSLPGIGLLVRYRGWLEEA